MVVLGDQLETCVAEVSQFEEGFERSHLERDVLGKIAGVQIFDTIVVMALDVDFQVERCSVLFEQVPKPTTLYGDRMMGQAVARCDTPVKRIPFAATLAHPERCGPFLWTNRHVHEFQLPGTNRLLEPVAGVLDQCGIRFDGDYAEAL